MRADRNREASENVTARSKQMRERLTVALIIFLTACMTSCGGGGGGNAGAAGGGGGGGGGAKYSIGGSITWLTQSGLVLTDNGGDALSVASGTSSFTFATQVPSGYSYTVAVSMQPAGQTCTVAGGSGTVTATVTSIAISCTPAIQILYSFGSSSTDATSPTGTLIRGSDGNFYGTTGLNSNGGPLISGNGTVFKITPTGEETVLHLFAGTPQRGPDGVYPEVLIEGSDGNFYGTTAAGGVSGGGTVFEVTPAGDEAILHNFAYEPGDSEPTGGLVQGTDGNLYGTTDGGRYIGSVFKLTPNGVETTLYPFTGLIDGQYPRGQLIQGSDGNFYGVTEYGGTGSYAFGTVFKVTPGGVKTTLHSFSGQDGGEPEAGLIQGSDGNFYGTTILGAQNNGVGTVFKLTPEGDETILYSFSGPDGELPQAALTLGSDGNLYGTTFGGGDNNGGTLFQVTPAGVVTVLYSFPSQAGPHTNLVQGSDGNLYGTTYAGGAYNSGYFFKVVLPGH
jgi:uncharacterized repeat protein (TIGR03803 family)